MNYRESYKYDPMPEKDEHRPCPPPPHPHSKHKTETTILRCGTSIGSTPVCCGGPSLDGGGWHPTVLATVALDTRELIDPTVRIDFSSLVSFKTTCDYNYLLRLVFKLSKVCGGCPIPLGTWTFEECQYPGTAVDQADGGYVQETESFCFSWCSCDDCPGCCRYIVELVDQQCYNIDFAIVSNISLSALAVGLKETK
jgi:hypothetical protein